METIDPIQQQLIDARRNQILDAATAVFSEKGFHKATIRAIAQYAGIADGTIYNYFKNKTDLLIGILDRLNESEQREADFTAGLSGGDVRGFMLAYIRHRIDIIWSQKEVFRALLPEVISNAELRELYYSKIIAPTFGMAEGQFQRLVEAEIIRPIEVPLTLRAMAGTFFGTLMLSLWGDELIDERLEALPEVLVTMMFDGLKADNR